MSGALGLTGYGSSDDEEDVAAPVVGKANQAVTNKTIGDALPDVTKSNPQNITCIQNTPPGPALGPAAGPAPGPLPAPAPMPEQLPGNTPDAPSGSGQGSSAPPSPYSANRIMVRNLTMPPVPNFDIPPSPPGSPPPATTAKFARFLELKKKGNHFNERLNQSSALRNPGLLGKLIDFAGISEEDQYATTLPQDMAVPTKFPDWTYADKLVAAHEKIAKKKEEQERARGPREALDFVPAKQQEPSASWSGRVERRVEGGESSSGRVERRGEGRKKRFDDGRPSRSPR